MNSPGPPGRGTISRASGVLAKGPPGAGLSLFLVLSLGPVLGGCASGEGDQAAYEACLAAAKQDRNYANAGFASREQSNIQGSAGDSGLRVNIPYELGGKKGLYQCIAEKQPDGRYKVTF